MVFKKGRKGRKGRRSGRKYGKRLARGGSRMMRTLGFTKNGIKVGRMVCAGSAIATPFIPAIRGSDGQNYSSAQILMGQGPFASTSFNNKIMGALASSMWVGLGWRMPVGVQGGASGTDAPSGAITAVKGVTGMGVLAGVGLTIAGKFANPMLASSAVKL